MNSQDKFKEDLLRQYISPEQIEKAPEGLTSKVMAQIQMEPLHQKNSKWFRKRSLIPVISGTITVLLLLAALFSPESETDSLSLTLSQLIEWIKFNLPEFEISSIFNFSMPALSIYIFIGILILTFFDKALNMFFNREK